MVWAGRDVSVFLVCKGGRVLGHSSYWSYWSYLSQPSLLMGDRKVAVRANLPRRLHSRPALQLLRAGAVIHLSRSANHPSLFSFTAPRWLCSPRKAAWPHRREPSNEMNRSVGGSTYREIGTGRFAEETKRAGASEAVAALAQGLEGPGWSFWDSHFAAP